MFNTLAGKFGGFAGGSSGGHLGSFYTTSNTAFIVPAETNFVVVKLFGGTGVNPRDAKISNTHYQYSQGGHTTVKLGGPAIHSNTFFITVDGVGSQARDAIGAPTTTTLGGPSGNPGMNHQDPGTAFRWGHDTSGGTVTAAQRLAASSPSPDQAYYHHAGIYGGGYVALSAIELVDISSQANQVARMTVLQNSIIGLAGGSGSTFSPPAIGPTMGGSGGIEAGDGGAWVGPVPGPAATAWPSPAKDNAGRGANTTVGGAGTPAHPATTKGKALEGGRGPVGAGTPYSAGAGGHGYFGGSSGGPGAWPGSPPYPGVFDYGGGGGGGSNFIISSPSPHYPKISDSANSLYSATTGWNVADPDFDAIKDLHFPSSSPGSDLGTSGFAVIKFFGDNPGSFDTDDKAGLYPAIDTWTSGFQANTADASIQGGYISDVLLVGGGGWGQGGGGGGGGFKHIQYLFKNQTSYPITVGLGGIHSGPPAAPSFTHASGSILGTPNVNIEAHGGGPGGGGLANPADRRRATTGGGGTGSGQTAALRVGHGWEGFPGGDGVNLNPGPGAHASGGGGGAGKIGATVPPLGGTGGDGGAGKMWINGVTYGGGGSGTPKPAYSPSSPTPGGGGWGNPNPGVPTHPVKITTYGTDGLGGGGAAGVAGPLYEYPKGGSGVVIIAYPGGQKGIGGTVSSSGGKTYHTYTANGTYTSS